VKRWQVYPEGGQVEFFRIAVKEKTGRASINPCYYTSDGFVLITAVDELSAWVEVQRWLKDRTS
jgi:hypothetical protein